MNPLDRSLTPPSPQQEAQASSPQQADSPAQANNSLQANIINVGAANTSQPVTMAIPIPIPLAAANAPQFVPVPSHPHLLQSPEEDLFYPLNASNQDVINALSDPELTLRNRTISQQLNVHRNLLNGINIPIFKYELSLIYMISKDRLILQDFIKEVFTRLEKQSCNYDRAKFICSLLMLADRQYHSHQTLRDLYKLIDTYIPNPNEDEYLPGNLNINWPYSQQVRETQDLEKSHVDSITPEIKKSIYLKMEELIRPCTPQQKKKGIKRTYYTDAAFAYGAPPGVLRFWVMDGKKLYKEQVAGNQASETAGQLPRAAEPPSRVLGQSQIGAGVVDDDGQRPGPSRSARASATLRFEPYPRAQPSADLRIQRQAEALGLSPASLQEFNLDRELDPQFNAQMQALPWPRVTSGQFIQELTSGRYVIAPATRMEIGRFIIENCPADARVYKYAALRYGVALSEIVKWASEASE